MVRTRFWTMVLLVAGVRSLSTTPLSPLASLLRNPALLLPQLMEAEESATSDESWSFPVYNPAHPSKVLAKVPKQGRHEARQAIARAQVALPSWRDGTTAMKRSQLLMEWSNLIQDHAEDLATIMTLESGKPLAESRGEVAYGRSFLDYFAGEAVRSNGAGGGFLIPSAFVNPETGGPRGQMMAVHQAVGVSALITPWNFPLAMIARKAGPALAAGCTVVIKPSELTPLTAMALQNLARQAGIPQNVVQLVTADRTATADVGHELCTNPIVRKLSFTGSTRVGKALMGWCSETTKRLTLELGGNAPFIVFEDADLAQAVDAAVVCKFRNAGQTCVSADRFLIHESVHDAFVERFTAAVVQLFRMGDGMDPKTTLGPLITAEATAAIDSKVQLAIFEDGASCVLGGVPLSKTQGGESRTHFYAPTILTEVPVSSQLWKTETFGPVAAIRSFSTEQEALRLANDCPAGLAAYFCTRNLSRVFRFSQRLECGIVGVNDGIISTCVSPFGGVKESGLGREGGALGMAEYLETKYIFLNA